MWSSLTIIEIVLYLILHERTLPGYLRLNMTCGIDLNGRHRETFLYYCRIYIEWDGR